jgi:hypothetical protein
VKYSFALLFAAVSFISSTGCSGTKHTGVSVPAIFRSAVSTDAQTLVAIELDQLKASELYKRHREQLESQQINAMSERAGLDPRRDLAKMLVVWDRKQLLLLAKGSFSPAQIEAKSVAGGAQRVSYKNFTLFARGPEAVVAPDGNLLIAGPIPAVEAALDMQSSQQGSVPDELQQRLSEVPADAQMWVVSRGGLPGTNSPLPPMLASALSNFAPFVSGTAAGMRFDSGAHLQARILCKSADGAQHVTDTMRGLVGLARLTTKDNELDLLRMWDAVSISKDDNIVRLQADLPADLADKLIAQLMTFRGRAGALLRAH